MIDSIEQMDMKTRVVVFLGLVVIYFVGVGLLNGYDVAVGTGESMEPRISEGDLIVYSDTSYENLEKGEIVVYEAQNRTIAHLYKGSGVTKGINNNSIDPTQVTQSNIKGTVEFVIPTSIFILN